MLASAVWQSEPYTHTHTHTHTFPGGTSGKNPPANAGDTKDVGSIPGLGTSPGVGIGNLLQYLCLENSMNREEFSVFYNQFSSVIYFVHSRAHMWPSKVRGGGLEELPHVQGAAAALGTGEPRGATPHSRSGGVAMRRYLSSKVRSSGCALLEQPWRDNPRPR